MLTSWPQTKKDEQTLTVQLNTYDIKKIKFPFKIKKAICVDLTCKIMDYVITISQKDKQLDYKW